MKMGYVMTRGSRQTPSDLMHVYSGSADSPDSGHGAVVKMVVFFSITDTLASCILLSHGSVL